MFLRLSSVVATLLAASALLSPASAAGPVKKREFLFTYATQVTGLQPDETARIWLPMPQTTEDQEVTLVKTDLPAKEKIGKEPKYGNQILYVEAKAGKDGGIPLSVTYRVKRFEVKADMKTAKDDMKEIELFLMPDKMVPVGGKPLALLEGRTLPRDQVRLGRVLYDAVNDHMRYSKEGTGWGRGDAVWACDSRFGNCSDFHSLFIALSRSKNMPAKFEMGFSIPTKRGDGEVAGYHCWAKFKPVDRGWIPVDISEADKNPDMKDYYFGNLTEDRVSFTVGRDLELTPAQNGLPLNFFIYPYAEAAGKPVAAERIKRKFTYEDVK